jgi:hypothetical protein
LQNYTFFPYLQIIFKKNASQSWKAFITKVVFL